VLRRLVAGAVAAVVAGLVLGALARVLMAAMTVVAGGTPSVTFAGTGFILGLWVAVMVPGALVAATTTHRLRLLLPIGGAVFLAVPAAGTALDDLGSTVGFGTAQWVGVGTAAAAVFATIPMLPVVTVRLVDRWAGRPAAATRTVSPVAAGR
jgi:hypothetical protein